MPLKAGGGARRNASIEQGTQVSMATQRAATTTRHRHTEKLSGNIYQPVYLPRPTKRETRGLGGGANCHTNAQFGAQNCMISQSEYTSSKAQRRSVCQIGVHDLQTPLTSIGLILTWPKLHLATLIIIIIIIMMMMIIIIVVRSFGISQST